ncbi:MAG: cyclic nucleotide-binding domain-containing protein [Nitrospinaceae bacterium]
MGLHRTIPRTKQHLLKILDGIPFFDIFDPSEKKELASSNNYVIDCDPDTKIVCQGDMDFSVYILLRGEVTLTRDEQPDFAITTLKPGAVFGEISFLNRCPRPTNVLARGKVKVLMLNGELFKTLSNSTQIKLKDQFIKILTDRIEEMNGALMQIKSELDRVLKAEGRFREDFHRIIKSGARLEGVFENVSQAVTKIIR